MIARFGRRRAQHFGGGMLAVVFAACAAVPGDSPAEAIEAGAPLLGVGFGTLVVIEARAITNTGYPDDEFLRVLRIGDAAIGGDVVLPWTYASWRAEDPAHVSSNGFVVEPGCTYRLRGFETGAWHGIPPAAHAMADGGWPPGGTTFGFVNVFRVMDGELLERGALRGPDPENVRRRK
jgi:hypothetical protein